MARLSLLAFQCYTLWLDEAIKPHVASSIVQTADHNLYFDLRLKSQKGLSFENLPLWDEL